MRSSARPSEAPNRQATVASVYASINDIPRLSEANTGIPSAILGVTKFPGDPNYWYLLGFNTMTPKVYWAASAQVVAKFPDLFRNYMEKLLSLN